MAETPEVVHDHEFMRDEFKKEWKPKEIPTSTIKRAIKLNTAGDDALLGSHTINGTATMRLIYLSASLVAPGTLDMYLADRDGTIDNFLIYNRTDNTRPLILQGGPNNPIHVCKGSFSIRNRGSADFGTVAVAWEGIES